MSQQGNCSRCSIRYSWPVDPALRLGDSACPNCGATPLARTTDRSPNRHVHLERFPDRIEASRLSSRLPDGSTVLDDDLRRRGEAPIGS